MQMRHIEYVKNRRQKINGPRQANLVLIACASSEGSGEPAHLLLAHTSSESRGTFRQKARSLASLNGWACAVKICHDGMLKDTNSLDAPQMFRTFQLFCHKRSFLPTIYLRFT